MSVRKGAKRTPLSGVGHADDNERWFRFYSTDVMADLRFVSCQAVTVYLDRLVETYFKLGDPGPLNEKRAAHWFSKRKYWAAVEELRSERLLVGDGDMPKHYAPKNHGFAIKRKPIPNVVRDSVFARDGWACVYCGSDQNLTIDHIIPVTDRGSDSPKNLATACQSCNASKGDWSESNGE